ncbi:serine hydrolase domain-containing protein [Sphingomonas sp.]|uniref:serine hydrolase domain-containing protein n=1 Tax=Sphingomonas sp. TaxID=28214 RepID=UPI001B131DCC|nr:serine hydrolase domain-containing protein [Sphingomonas sp.]MBO9714189.1 beta-lactamase family protein [Sphingomonas sp.]
MRMKWLGIPALGLLLVTGVAAPARPPERIAAAKTQALVSDYVATDKVPGMVVAIGKGDADPVFVAAGKVGIAPTAHAADPDSLWRVYSMTKPITGIAAMILVQDGKLKLDQPISDFIPAFKTMRVLDDPAGTTLASRPATRPITVRNLLTHTAGLGYTIITKGPLLDEYNKLGINPAQVSRGLEPSMRSARPATLEAFANQVATLPLIAEPGAKWSYSIGLDVLGRVIEVASGMPFDKFLQTRIFDPLKMRSTYFTVPASEVGRFADNYFYTGSTRIPLDPAASSVWLDPPSFPYGGAGLIMSSRDYDRFLHMLANYGTLDGMQVLKPEIAKLAMSNLLPEGADTSILNATVALGGKLGFGAGGSVYVIGAPGVARAGTYGWGGAASTIAWVDAANGLRGNVMVNYMPTEHWPLRADLNKALAADLGL